MCLIRCAFNVFHILIRIVRMNATITQLANDVVYGGLLQCGNDVVKNATISLQHHDRYLADNFGPDGWITSTLLLNEIAWSMYSYV